MSTPPICDKCGKPLERIGYYTYSAWTFNSETGAYENTTMWGGTADSKCSHCENDVSEHFPEGPVNYGHELGIKDGK